jgi:hypothetical protein
MDIKTSGTLSLVVDVRVFEETHKIVQIFSRDYGKISCFARSAVRSKKRFGNQLDLGNKITAFVQKPAQERQQKLWSLESIELVDMPLRARASLSSVDVIFFLLSAIKDLFPFEEGDALSFDLISGVFQLLETDCSAKQLSWVKLSFALWLKERLGYGEDHHLLYENLKLESSQTNQWIESIKDLNFFNPTILKTFDSFPNVQLDSLRLFYLRWKELSHLSWGYFERKVGL